MIMSQPPILRASAVIFDVDGTLVDSVDFHADAQIHMTTPLSASECI
jgi:beta-phosphoglucomutase-like phosphatase (HAD superfamily)